MQGAAEARAEEKSAELRSITQPLPTAQHTQQLSMAFMDSTPSTSFEPSHAALGSMGAARSGAISIPKQSSHAGDGDATSPTHSGTGTFSRRVLFCASHNKYPPEIIIFAVTGLHVSSRAAVDSALTVARRVV